jgi:hypothetical protein
MPAAVCISPVPELVPELRLAELPEFPELRELPELPDREELPRGLLSSRLDDWRLPLRCFAESELPGFLPLRLVVVDLLIFFDFTDSNNKLTTNK